VAIFFGQSQPGGAINYVTKRPIDEFLFEASTQFGSNDMLRFDLDVNAPIVDGLALRVLATDQESDGWRQFERMEELYVGTILKWDLFNRITLIIEGEHLDRTFAPAGSPIITNPLYHDDYFNPPDALLFLPQDSSYGRNPWNRGFGREDTLRRWQGTIRENRDNWMRARAAAFPEVGFPLTISQIGFDGSEYYEANKDSFENAIADVYGPDANLAGDDSLTEATSDIAYYEVSIRPSSWLSFKASGNFGKTERGFRVRTTSVNRPFADFTIAGTRVDIGWVKEEYQNHIADLVIKFDIFGSTHKLITGGEGRWNEELRTRFGRSWPADLSALYKYWDPRTLDFPPLSEVYPAYTGDPDDPGVFEDVDFAPQTFKVRRLGAYLMHQGTFFKERLHTMMGIRHENQVNDKFTTPVLGWQEEGVTSGTSKAIGFVYELTDTLNFYASWNQNFKANTEPTIQASDAGDLNEQDLAEFGFLGDETGTGIDVGFKFEAMKNRLSGQVSFFEIEREGIARLDWERSNQRMLDEGWTDLWFRVEYYVNGGLERARGVELEILATPVEGWQILIGYTHYFEADVINDPGLSEAEAARVIGQGLPNVSDDRLSIWTNYEFTEGRFEGFSAGAGLRYASEHNPLVYDWQNNILHDSYLVFDARAGYTFDAMKGRMKLSLSVNNLTDELYSEGGIGYSSPRTWIGQVSYTF
jgi:outer membrane receptor protein involved in Fe transport